MEGEVLHQPLSRLGGWRVRGEEMGGKGDSQGGTGTVGHLDRDTGLIDTIHVLAGRRWPVLKMYLLPVVIVVYGYAWKSSIKFVVD